MTRSAKLIWSQLIFLLLFCFSLQSCGEDKKNNAPTPAAKAGEAKTENATNQVLEQANKIGISGECSERIGNLSNFLISGGQYAAVVYSNGQKKDTLFSSTIARQGKDGSHLASMNVSLDQGCPASFEIVKVWVNNCQQVIANSFPKYQLKGQLTGNVKLFGLQGGADIYAMPTAGQGCVTIQKSMVFAK